MYSKNELEQLKLKTFEDHGVEQWDGYELALSKATSTRFHIRKDGKHEPSNKLQLLVENGVENWDGYEDAMNEFEMFKDLLADELGLVSFKEFTLENPLSLLSRDLTEDEVLFIKTQMKEDVKMESIMADPSLNAIAREIKELRPNSTDFEVAHLTVDFNRNSKFYTPNTRLGLNTLDNTKKIVSDTVYPGLKLTTNEYLLVAKPIFLALSIQSGYLKEQVESYLN